MEVGEAIGLEPRVIELLKLLHVARQRTMRAWADAPGHHVERAGKPDRDAMILEELHISGLRRSASSDSDHCGTAARHSTHAARYCGPLNDSELPLAHGVKDV